MADILVTVNTQWSEAIGVFSPIPKPPKLFYLSVETFNRIFHSRCKDPTLERLRTVSQCHPRMCTTCTMELSRTDSFATNSSTTLSSTFFHSHSVAELASHTLKIGVYCLAVAALVDSAGLDDMAAMGQALMAVAVIQVHPPADRQGLAHHGTALKAASCG